MESVTVWRGTAYRHRQPRLGSVACPTCGSQRVVFRQWRRRLVEYPDPEQPTDLVLRVPKYACREPACPRRYFTPPVAEAALYARTSHALQRTATRQYRRGTAGLRAVAEELRPGWHTRTGKSSVLRWHRATLAADYPRPERLSFSQVLCIDEVYDRVGGKQRPVFTGVDLIARITVRLPVARADAEQLAVAMVRVRALGANPRVVVADLWAAYPAALRAVWPRAQRQLCWFHFMQWLTRTLARLIRDYGQTLPEPELRALNRLRFRLLACADQPEQLTDREGAALARAGELVRGTVVEEALRLRHDLRAVLNTSTSRAAARERFEALRASWPARWQPWTWRPGQPLPAPRADATAGMAGLAGYLEQIRAFFVRHVEMLITCLGQPGVPRTSNAAERANRRYRAVARPRYGWKTAAGQQAMLLALQGFDSS